MEDIESQITSLYKEKYNDFVRISSRIISQGSYNPEQLAQYGPEDVVQEAFTRALHYKNSFDPKFGSLLKWFNSILYRCAVDFKNDERMGGLCDEICEEDYVTSSSFGTDNKIIEEIKRDIELLEGEDKQICHLYFIKQYRPREVVQITGAGSVYVRTTVKKFLATLREKYGGSCL